MRICSVRVGAINARNERNCINIVKQDNSPKIKKYGNGFLLDHESIMKNTDWIRIRNCKKVIINYQTHILCYIAARKLENDNQLTIDRPLRTKNMKFFIYVL